MSATSTAPDSVEHQRPLVDILLFLQILWARKAIVLLAVAAALLLAGLYLAVTKPSYTAIAVVLVDPRETRTTDSQGVLPGIGSDSAAIASQVAIIRSRELLEPVFRSEHIAEDPEFRDPGLLASLIGSITGRPPAVPESVVFDRFAAQLAVEREGLTYVLDINFKAQDRDKAARIVNAVVDQYIGNQVKQKSAANAGATEVLGHQVAGLQQSVKDAEEAVEDFKVAHGIYDSGAGAGTTVLQAQLDQLNTQLLAAQEQARQANAKYEQAKAAGTSPEGLQQLTQILSSPAADKLRDDYNQRAAAVANSQSRLGPRHPTLISQQAELTRVEKMMVGEAERITAELKAAADVSNDTVKKIKADLDALRDQLNTANRNAVQLRQLERNADASRAVLEQFQKRSQETGQLESLQVSDARVISSATPPETATWPKPSLLLIVSGLIGLAVGSAIALLLGLPRPRLVQAAAMPGPTAVYTPIQPAPMPPPLPVVVPSPLQAVATRGPVSSWPRVPIVVPPPPVPVQAAIAAPAPEPRAQAAPAQQAMPAETGLSLPPQIPQSATAQEPQASATEVRPAAPAVARQDESAVEPAALRAEAPQASTPLDRQAEPAADQQASAAVERAASPVLVATSSPVLVGQPSPPQNGQAVPAVDRQATLAEAQPALSAEAPPLLPAEVSQASSPQLSQSLPEEVLQASPALARQASLADALYSSAAEAPRVSEAPQASPKPSVPSDLVVAPLLSVPPPAAKAPLPLAELGTLPSRLRPPPSFERVSKHYLDASRGELARNPSTPFAAELQRIVAAILRGLMPHDPPFVLLFSAVDDRIENNRVAYNVATGLQRVGASVMVLDLDPPPGALDGGVSLLPEILAGKAKLDAEALFDRTLEVQVLSHRSPDGRPLDEADLGGFLRNVGDLFEFLVVVGAPFGSSGHSPALVHAADLEIFVISAGTSQQQVGEHLAAMVPAEQRAGKAVIHVTHGQDWPDARPADGPSINEVEVERAKAEIRRAHQPA